MPIIETNNLTKTYKNNRGINNITLSIEAGQVYGILGPNGSGKTTLMKVICGFLYANGGSIQVFGKDPASETPEIMQKTGCLIETPALYGYLTAWQNIRQAARMVPNVSASRGEEVLRLLEIYDYRNEKVSGFSLGMKQRLAIALALYADNELLILDEPTNGMDIGGMTLIREIIKKERERGKTILLSSHLAHELEQVCDQVCIINSGKLVDIASVSSIINHHRSLETFYLTVINGTEGGVIQ